MVEGQSARDPEVPKGLLHLASELHCSPGGKYRLMLGTCQKAVPLDMLDMVLLRGPRLIELDFDGIAHTRLNNHILMGARKHVCDKHQYSCTAGGCTGQRSATLDANNGDQE